MTTTRWMILCSLLALPLGLLAQQTALYTDAQAAYKKAQQYYAEGLFAEAYQLFDEAAAQARPLPEGSASILRETALLYKAQSAVRLGWPEGERLVQDFIRQHAASPLVNQAKLEMANYYYNTKDYERAIGYYNAINAYEMSVGERAELKFKLGYAYFVRKKNAQAKAAFREIKDLNTPWYYPANYYYGMTAFYDNDYDEALASFEKANATNEYKRVVPSYLVQIYFAKGQFDKVITYGEAALADGGVRYQEQIRQMVGQAYFEKKIYEKALPYLEAYAQRGTLSEQEWYQLGFAQYQMGRYADAAKSFGKIGLVDSKLAQSALYHLGDVQLRLNDKVAARSAFSAASRMAYDPAVQEEALYNYAKLSYELKDPSEAVNAIQRLSPSSIYYAEGQEILSNIFLNTRDYEQALRIIEAMPNRTPQIRETYQRVAYLRGVQLYQGGKLGEAATLFGKSLADAPDLRTRAEATFWMADISYRTKKYDQSIRELNQFLTMAKTLSDLPDESSVHTANYNLGYNYIKKGNYKMATEFFEAAVDGIKKNRNRMGSDYVRKRVLHDATLRAADGYFSQNSYAKAKAYYQEAYDNKYTDYDYALFQKALIEGLQGEPIKKILTLEELVDKIPQSAYADDALFQAGSTYFSLSKLDLALAPLRQLVQQYQQSELLSKAYLQIGLISFNQGNYDKSLEAYEQVLRNNPEAEDSRQALRNIEEIFRKRNDAQGFFDYAENTLGISLDNIAKDSITFQVAERQYENGDYAKAAESFSSYLARFSKGLYALEAHFYRGDSYLQLKDYDKALKDYEAVIGRGSSAFLVKSLRNAAVISYDYKADYNASFTYFSQLAEKASDPADRILGQLGALRAAYRSGRRSEVLSAAPRLLATPGLSNEQKAETNFYLGKAALDSKDYAKATTAFNVVIASGAGAEKAEAMYQVAFIAYVQRKLSEAKTLAEKVRSQGNADWTARSFILLSDIYLEQGDLIGARAPLEVIVDNYKGDQLIINEAKSKLEALKARSNQNLRRSESGDGNREMDEPSGN